jgi:hypothetical protein
VQLQEPRFKTRQNRVKNAFHFGPERLKLLVEWSWSLQRSTMCEFMKPCLDDLEPGSARSFGLAQSEFAENYPHLLLVRLCALSLDAAFVVSDRL